MKQYQSSLVGSLLGVGLNPLQIPQFLGHYWQQRIILTAPGSYSVVVPSLNPEDKNSVVNVVFQVRLYMYYKSGKHLREKLL